MNEEQGILQAICDHPEDPVQRLAYADWLDEHSSGARGDPNFDQASFIRAQVALESGFEAAGAPLTRQRRTELERQVEDLLPGQQSAWMVRLAGLGVKGMDCFRGGFPAEVSLSAGDFLIHAGELFVRAPVIGVRITDSTPEQIQALADSEHLSNLSSLDLRDNNLGNNGVRALAHSEHLGQLTRLDLESNRISLPGVQALAASEHLTNLTTLGLQKNHIFYPGALALASSANFRRLASLNLESCIIEQNGTEALANSEHLARLENLNLGDNLIGNEGAQALANSEHLARLVNLNLGDNLIGNEGAQALANSEHLRRLTTLNLTNNDVGDYMLNEIHRILERRRAEAREGP